MLTYKSYFLKEKDRLKVEEIIFSYLHDINEEEILRKDDHELLNIYRKYVNKS
ncbi:hypothetical protein [Bacillus sp. SA1-12]|uniref:hypothetical protein n=1 Tax=Bacillus sp. SA1-12 TaxID=1455638 RepID=UPI000AEB4595|nr:hypothetical protein [Bacillus sp. SA1-12]